MTTPAPLNPTDLVRLADTPAPDRLTAHEVEVWRRIAPDLDALGTVTRRDLVAVKLLVQALAAAERLMAPEADGGDPALASDFADLAADWRERLTDGGTDA